MEDRRDLGSPMLKMPKLAKFCQFLAPNLLDFHYNPQKCRIYACTEPIEPHKYHFLATFCLSGPTVTIPNQWPKIHKKSNFLVKK